MSEERASTREVLRALAAYRPVPALRVPRSGRPAAPRLPVTDAHNHLGPTPFSGPWAAASASELGAVMDACGVVAIVDLDGGQGDALRREIERWSPLGERVAVFAGLDYPMWERRTDFGEEEARRLRDAAGAGARGLKVWKTLGLRARDLRGRLVPVDDPRLDPLWAAAGELGLPVTIHVADPIAFFEPLDLANERLEELAEHPDWHFWPARARGATEPAEPAERGAAVLHEPGFAPFDELIYALEAVVARHPGTTFIGAHVGCAAEDLSRVGAMLERYPNWHVDLAARIGELGRQPYTARDLIVRFADRVLFGTDDPPDRESWATYWQFLETADEAIPYDADGGPGSQGRWPAHALHLPDDVLRAVCYENARRVVFPRLPAAPALAAPMP